MCAYMYMSSRVSGTRIKGCFKPRSWVTPELKRCVYLDHNEALHSSRSLCLSQDGIIDAVDTQTISYPQKEPTTRAASADFQLSGAFELQPFRHLDSQKTINRKLRMGWMQEPIFDSATLRRTRHMLAAAAVQTFPAVRARFNKLEPDPKDPSVTRTLTYEPLIEQLVVRNARNWPSDFLLPGLGGELMGMTLWFATMAYGGVHIAAWNEYFPTRAEQQLWRLSSVYIACSGLLWLLMNVFGAISPWASLYWDRFIAFQAFWVEYIVYGVTATACGILYIFARAFLVVDAIVSLRQLPVQIYSTPQWSEIIPHL
ncbi:hypothetical protein BGZ57DRAFT_934427 [Hyaloscypha finlandica]|nr:hypothetical protein BGZ57DRAFT_934427 [Hyaloscypha finlandica]